MTWMGKDLQLPLLRYNPNRCCDSFPSISCSQSRWIPGCVAPIFVVVVVVVVVSIFLTLLTVIPTLSNFKIET